jgi:hypothetical protein
MIRLNRHLKLLVAFTLAWFLFWVIGLPDYYRQYSTTFMIGFDIVVFLPLWFILYSSIKKSRSGKGLTNSLWLAFYFTFPLFIYDFLYCGIYLGYGIGFIWEYWYLSVYYVIPWLILPPTGWWVDRQQKQERK